MDGDTSDCIHWFAKWYNDRLAAMPTLGGVITDLYREIFNPDIAGKAPRIYVLENTETWRATEDEYGFWIDTDGNNRPDSWNKGCCGAGVPGSLKLQVVDDDPQKPEGVIYVHDIYFIDWMQQRFIPLLKKLNEYGYGLSADLDDLLDKIDKLIKEVGGTEDEPGFEDVIASLYGTTYDGQIQTFETWFPPLYDGSDKQDWYDRMQDWLDMVDEWISTLELRTDQINDCVGSCKAYGPYKCGPNDGPVCERIYVEQTCTGTDAAGNTYTYDCSYCEDATGWCNCRNGKMIDGGRLCPSPHCKPDHECQTPPDGGKGVLSIPCCTIADNGLYYQLCEVTRDACCGGNDPECGAIKCIDSYYDCRYDPNNNVITREHAIDYLTQFRNDVRALRSAFRNAETQAQARKTYPGECEALYHWTDKVGRKGEVTEQEVQHAALVKLSDNLKTANGFKVPYIHQGRDWWPLPARCTEVLEEEGEFDITVARYDSDVGTTAKSPLRNLWKLKTRRKPAEGEPAFQPNADFVLQNGIVSQTRAHYGPGWTYTKAEIKSGATQASMRNKDIYIKRLK
jgi:hypothetical protein